MPIRTVPWDQLSVQHVRDLIEREIRESRTLDYKQELKLDDSGKLDLLEDVTAMANAAGGTIVYGAVEGEGEDRGLIVDVNPMPLKPDTIDLSVANLLRDNVAERIHQVLHCAVPVEGGGYLYVIRVPPSPRAPHMVTKKSARDRFFLRTNVSNEPMRMQQIREAVLRSDTALERAERFLETRTAAVRAHVQSRPLKSAAPSERMQYSAALIHLVPLFQPAEGVDLAAPSLAEQMKDRRGIGQGYGGNLRWALEGLYNQYASDGEHRSRWVLLARGGELEFGRSPYVYPGRWSSEQSLPTLDVFHLDSDVRGCLAEAKELAAYGIFSPPFVLSLRLLNIDGTMLTSHKSWNFQSQVRWQETDLIVPPEVVTDWDASLAHAERRLFNTVWQAFGFAKCEFYTEDGRKADINQAE